MTKRIKPYLIKTHNTKIEQHNFTGNTCRLNTSRLFRLRFYFVKCVQLASRVNQLLNTKSSMVTNVDPAVARQFTTPSLSIKRCKRLVLRVETHTQYFNKNVFLFLRITVVELLINLLICLL